MHACIKVDDLPLFIIISAVSESQTCAATNTSSGFTTAVDVSTCCGRID
jgi:hypothetical protein